MSLVGSFLIAAIIAGAAPEGWKIYQGEDKHFCFLWKRESDAWLAIKFDAVTDTSALMYYRQASQPLPPVALNDLRLILTSEGRYQKELKGFTVRQERTSDGSEALVFENLKASALDAVAKATGVAVFVRNSVLFQTRRSTLRQEVQELRECSNNAKTELLQSL